MKLVIVSALLAGSLPFAHAQSCALSRVELSPEIVNYGPVSTSYKAIPDSKETKLFSGGIIRYNIDRFAVRAGFNYSSGSTASNQPYYFDNTSGQAANKEFKIRFGGQYGLSKKHKWLYLFADAFLDHLRANGSTVNGTTGVYKTYALLLNSPGIDIGIGFKFKICPHIYISPEIYYDTKFDKGIVTETNTTGAATVTSENGITNATLDGRLSFILQL